MARLTTGALELLSRPTALKTRLRPEWAGSTVCWLALVLRKVALEACSSRSGPLSVCGRSKAIGPGQPEVWVSGLALPTAPASYHVVQEAFVDRNEECLVGEFIVQEVQEVETSWGGVGVAQQHLGSGGR